jgi:hypothetical protein
MLSSNLRVLFSSSSVVVSSIANVCWRRCKSRPGILISGPLRSELGRVNTEQSTRAVVSPNSLRHQTGVIRKAPTHKGAAPVPIDSNEKADLGRG